MAGIVPSDIDISRAAKPRPIAEVAASAGILPAEALFALTYAEAHGVETGTLGSRPAGRCPLYRPDVDAHCPIYPARPLVCRLFGFSALPDKRGELVYTPCEHMPGSRGSRPVRTLGLPDAALPPDMTAYASRLSLLEPGGEASRALLRFAFRDAGRRIGLYASLLEGEERTGNSGEFPGYPLH